MSVPTNSPWGEAGTPAGAEVSTGRTVEGGSGETLPGWDRDSWVAATFPTVRFPMAARFPPLLRNEVILGKLRETRMVHHSLETLQQLGVKAEHAHQHGDGGDHRQRLQPSCSPSQLGSGQIGDSHERHSRQDQC